MNFRYSQSQFSMIKLRTKRRAFIVDKALGFLAISESEGTKNGARPVTDMLLDGTHIRVQRNRKAIREGDDRVDDRGWELRGDKRLSPTRVLFWTAGPNERLLYIPASESLPCLFQSATTITSSSREAALRACCALLSFNSSSSS